MIAENVIQKRWKVLREKFSLAYRKQVLEEINSNWSLYDMLTFLEPFVNLKPDAKKSKNDESYGSENKSFSVAKSPLDEQVLIQLVKDRPVLFDKKNEDFRVANARKKAWEEISSIVNWDVETLQRRWRVMRDRFVRELRKSKNAESDTQLNCSSFFREMLFLTQHVRSKKYEVEAHFDDSGDSRGEYEYESCDSKYFSKKEAQRESSNVEIVIDQDYEQYIEDNDEPENSIRYDEEIMEEEHVQIHDDEFIEEIVECTQNDEGDIISQDAQNIVTMEVISKDHWDKHENASIDNNFPTKKRQFSNSEDTQHQPPKIARTSETQYTVVNTTDVVENDEDLTFGNTLGCMLKRIPQHLKTAVKLKLLQSLAEFEAEHKI